MPSNLFASAWVSRLVQLLQKDVSPHFFYASAPPAKDLHHVLDFFALVSEFYDNSGQIAYVVQTSTDKLTLNLRSLAFRSTTPSSQTRMYSQAPTTTHNAAGKDAAVAGKDDAAAGKPDETPVFSTIAELKSAQSTAKTANLHVVITGVGSLRDGKFCTLKVEVADPTGGLSLTLWDDVARKFALPVQGRPTCCDLYNVRVTQFRDTLELSFSDSMSKLSFDPDPQVATWWEDQGHEDYLAGLIISKDLVTLEEAQTLCAGDKQSCNVLGFVTEVGELKKGSSWQYRTVLFMDHTLSGNPMQIRLWDGMAHKVPPGLAKPATKQLVFIKNLQTKMFENGDKNTPILTSDASTFVVQIPTSDSSPKIHQRLRECPAYNDLTLWMHSYTDIHDLEHRPTNSFVNQFQGVVTAYEPGKRQIVDERGNAKELSEITIGHPDGEVVLNVWSAQEGQLDPEWGKHIGAAVDIGGVKVRKWGNNTSLTWLHSCSTLSTNPPDKVVLDDWYQSVKISEQSTEATPTPSTHDEHQPPTNEQAEEPVLKKARTLGD